MTVIIIIMFINLIDNMNYKERFVNRKLIGQGAYGKVYRAFDN